MQVCTVLHAVSRAKKRPVASKNGAAVKEKVKRDYTVTEVAAELLVPYAKNSRTHSKEQLEQIKRSIQEFGFTSPILADENHQVLAGHGRLEAAKALKLETVPVIVLTGLSEAQKRAYVIADNKIAERAGWDGELLMEELEWLSEEQFDLSLLGFSERELNKWMDSGSGGVGGADESGRLQAVFEILVECKDEAEQLALLKKFGDEGIECRALVS